MKTGILSDIHGNLESLDAVLGELRREGVDRLWCLGDIVGYGANPNECIERVREAASITVLGNHDAACAGMESATSFNPAAKAAVEWTARQLTPENRDWLKGLPMTEPVEDLLLVHASPHEPAAWHYIHSRIRPVDMQLAFAATVARVSFVGHSHQQMVLVQRGGEYYRFLGTSLQLEDGHRYLVNAGSTGQPRDGDPRAGYVIHDTKLETVTLGRTIYDVEAAQAKIRAAGLPEILAARLAAGN